MSSEGPRSLEAVLAAAPPPLRVPGAAERVRSLRERTGRRLAVLDDDPTGSQSVHGVEVVTALEPSAYAAALAEPASTCFVLTNTRSLDEPDARALTGGAGRDLLRLGRRLGAPVDLVSRSDSTLRGHVHAEVEALQAAGREVDGRAADAVLFVPAFLEAGRVTAGGTHWARVEGAWRPVGATEFARDASFGYRASDLADFLAERSGGALAAVDVEHLSLVDVRDGGVDRVAEVLASVRGGRWVVVDAVDQADLDVVALGVLQAEAAGHRLLHRTGPSFVRALAGTGERPPLSPGELPRPRGSSGHGLVVVGSHVGLTGRQVDHARGRADLVEVQLDVAALLDAGRRDQHVAAVAEQVRASLASHDVLLLTSRQLVRGDDAAASLAIARTTSSAVVEVVRAARAARPAWVVAKGGITSHDVAVHGLGVRRARVLGQVLPGAISVLEPLEAPEEVLALPYVVFAGNVGGDDALTRVLDLVGQPVG